MSPDGRPGTAVRQIYPRPDDVDAVALYGEAHRPAPPGRPWVLVNMIASIDGATALEGVSGPLGGPADKEAFRALRAAADVILVGSGTWSTEGYGPPRLGADLQEARRRRGLPPQPRICVVTGRLGIDLDARFFTDSPTRPMILTSPTADAARRDAATRVADVIVCGDDTGSVDLVEALSVLADDGVEVVVCEGGPRLNEDLVAAGLVDELCLTISPLVTGGMSHRLFGGVDIGDPLRFDLVHVLEGDGLLLCRYVRCGALAEATAAGGIPDAE